MPDKEAGSGKPKAPTAMAQVEIYGACANRLLSEHRKGGKLFASVEPHHAVRCMYKSERANFTCTCGAEELWQAWKAEAGRGR